MNTTERVQIDSAEHEAPLFSPPKDRFFAIRGSLSGRQSFLLGLTGLVALFAVWQIGHWVTPELQRKFLPGVDEVVGKIGFLLANKDFISDIGVSLYPYLPELFCCLLGLSSTRIIYGLFCKGSGITQSHFRRTALSSSGLIRTPSAGVPWPHRYSENGPTIPRLRIFSDRVDP